MSVENYSDGAVTCALSVTNIEDSMKWYEEVLGFSLLYYMEDIGWCEFKSPVPNVMVGLSQVETMPAPGGNAVLTWGVKDIESVKNELDAKNVRFDGDIQTIPEMVKLATFYDPDGNCFMLAQDLTKE